MTVKHQNRSVAKAILALLEPMLEYDLHKEEFLVDVYSNCREQGYTITLKRVDDKYMSINDQLWFAFSEHRNSDSIVVYKDKGDFNGFGLTEEAYKNGKFFGPEEIYEAVRYIYNEYVNYIVEYKNNQETENERISKQTLSKS